MKSIITELESTTISSAIELDETFDVIEHIPKLKTTLYPHQKTAIKAMLELENKRTLCIKTIPPPPAKQYVKPSKNRFVIPGATQPIAPAMPDKSTTDLINGILSTGVSMAELQATYASYGIDRNQMLIYKINTMRNVIQNMPTSQTTTTSSQIQDYKASQTTPISSQIQDYKASQTSESVPDTPIEKRISYNIGVFTDPVGVGKTIVVLGLILLSPKPRALPEIVFIDEYKRSYARGQFKKLLNPTLCIVNKSVLLQWELAIKRFTNLKYFIVKSVVELRTLFSMIENRDISKYDIIVIKNGRITVPFEMPASLAHIYKSNLKINADIYNLIANLYEYCWARVIVDDYDTVGLPKDTCGINALFTWLISSSKYKGYQGHSAPDSLDKTLIFRKISDRDINSNKYLFTYLNVRNNKAYIEANLAMPKVKYHLVCLKNESNKIISILKSVGDEDLARVSEMLNSNAINTAARLIGIESNSVQDIFKTVLGNKWTGYQQSTELITFIDFQSTDHKKAIRKSMNDNPDSCDTYGKQDLVSRRDIEYKYPGVDRLLTDSRDDQAKIKTKLGTEIDRIKCSLTDGECPICIESLKQVEEIIISKCCFVVMCSECAIKTNGFHDKFNHLQNGTCPNCRARTTIKNMIFFKTSLVKIDSIIQEMFADDNVDVDEKQIAAPVCEPKKEIKNKNEALLEIIRRGVVPGDIRIDMNIANMMPGRRVCEEPTFRKVLVFSNYDETLHNIEGDLKKDNIKYWHLHGSNYDIARIAAEFTDCVGCTCVMIINSTKYCSGLNLQSATDLVFMHFIHDINIETQVGGRGQRIGRDNQLNIWYLTNENEKHLLSQRYNTRELSADELLDEDEPGKNSETNCDIVSSKPEMKSTTKSKKSKSKKSASSSDDGDE